MAYLGVRRNYYSHVITAKLHGPISTFVINPSELKTRVDDYFRNVKVFNMIDSANGLSENLADSYCNGDTILWTEVTVESPEDIIYSSVSERVPVNV